MECEIILVTDDNVRGTGVLCHWNAMPTEEGRMKGALYAKTKQVTRREALSAHSFSQANEATSLRWAESKEMQI
jgi:hypothetical protein